MFNCAFHELYVVSVHFTVYTVFFLCMTKWAWSCRDECRGLEAHSALEAHMGLFNRLAFPDLDSKTSYLQFQVIKKDPEPLC